MNKVLGKIKSCELVIRDGVIGFVFELSINGGSSGVADLKVVDPVIEKEDQTHLDANYVGVGRNGCFYYRSDILKQWFYWNEDYEWGECDFDYKDVNDMLPVSFGIVFGESK